jgi:hypothetical protein
MGFWRLFPCFGGKCDPVPPFRPLDEDAAYAGQSPACTEYNILGLREAGYIDDREGLHNVLTTIFSEEHGSLDFGITVCQGCLPPVVGFQADGIIEPKRQMDVLRAKGGETGEFDVCIANARMD